MEQFEFSPAKIDDHIVKVGVDLRPPFEPKLDHSKLYYIGKQLQDAYPQLFESLVQSPSEFRIMKKFLFTGSTEAEVPTLATSPRGIVFTFPKRIAAVNEEVVIDHIDDIVVQCLQRIKTGFPQKKNIRTGLINEYIFDTADQDACRILCERFTKLHSPPGGDVRIRINNRTDDYNRIIEMQPLQKIKAMPEIPSKSQNVGYGLKVKVDFNNCDTSKDLEQVQVYTIIHEGQKYNEKGLYDFLNGVAGGQR
jgi:hypothetical protein